MRRIGNQPTNGRWSPRKWCEAWLNGWMFWWWKTDKSLTVYRYCLTMPHWHIFTPSPWFVLSIDRVVCTCPNAIILHIYTGILCIHIKTAEVSMIFGQLASLYKLEKNIGPLTSNWPLEVFALLCRAPKAALGNLQKETGAGVQHGPQEWLEWLGWSHFVTHLPNLLTHLSQIASQSPLHFQNGMRTHYQRSISDHHLNGTYIDRGCISGSALHHGSRLARTPPCATKTWIIADKTWPLCRGPGVGGASLFGNYP